MFETSDSAGCTDACCCSREHSLLLVRIMSDTSWRARDLASSTGVRRGVYVLKMLGVADERRR